MTLVSASCTPCKGAHDPWQASQNGEAMEGDRLWFARHHGWRYRLFQPDPAELTLMLRGAPPAAALPGVVVFGRGHGVISLCEWPLNNEETRRALWRSAVACKPSLKRLLENFAGLEQRR
jgi:hypothetical protein